MVTPPTIKLKSGSDAIPKRLPEVAELWLGGLEYGCEELNHQCPFLEKLRMTEQLHQRLVRDLEEILKRRKSDEEAGEEIGGTKIKSIKQLCIYFQEWDSKNLDSEEIREIVDELINLEDVSKFIDLDI